jgi:hypothetical protein
MSMVPASYNASWCDEHSGHFQLCGGNYKPAIGSVLLEPTVGRQARLNGDDAVTLFVAFERTVGVASLAEGTLEAMIQRNVGADGMGPPCNDTSNAQLPMHILLSPQTVPTENLQISAAEAQQHLLQQRVAAPLRLFTISAPTTFFSGFLRRGLPAGVTLQALEAWSRVGSLALTYGTSQGVGQTVLFRLLNRRSFSAAPLTLSFGELFSDAVQLVGVVETNLLGNEPLQSQGSEGNITSMDQDISGASANCIQGVILRSKDLRTFVGRMSLKPGAWPR